MVEGEFESVDISAFFGEREVPAKDDGIIVFTKKQQDMFDAVLPHLRDANPDRFETFLTRIDDLNNLAKSIARFPSLLEHHRLAGGERTPTSLIDSLVEHQDEGDALLQLPSKASLGRGFLIAKIHTFSSLSKIAKNIGEDEKKVVDLRNEAVTMMFSLLAEDVYLNCIRDKSVDIDLRREMAMSLLLLWEHRNDEAIEQIAPVLQSIWTARRKLAPAFGTMMGTSELILISMQMDEMWTTFIKERLSDSMVSQAMEEFLFGISFEQIKALREILKGQGIKAIGRDEVSKYLGVHVKTDAGLDYRDFYSMYTLRRDNARARSRLKVAGPQIPYRSPLPSGEDSGFPSVQTEGPVQREIAVIHALRRVFLHGFRKRIEVRVVFPQVAGADETMQADATHEEALCDENTHEARKKHTIRGVSNYLTAFPDSQAVQIVAANRWGVKPVKNRTEAEQRKKDLVYVGESPYYHVDPLYSSIPYLVPRAAVLLQDIGQAFYDSLYAKGIPLNKLIVTSVMRSMDDVAKLRKRNPNATEQSCHLFGTTIDICYNRYHPVTREVRNDTLKWVLSEVLRDMRQQERCYIKYEVKQGCFHMTVR